jgi:hypothetical protein
MTTTQLPPTVTSEAATRPEAEVPARRRFDVRRIAAIGLPALTGALLVAATATDPGTGSEAEKEMIEVYAANVDQLQWHMTFLHLSYGLWGLIPLALVALARTRGRQLMNVAVVLGAIAAISMPALMISDMFFAGIANHVDVDTADAIGKEIQDQQWALKTYILGLPSMALVLPFTFGALVRAGVARWWAIPLAIAPLPVFVISGTTVLGAAAASVVFAGLSVVVAKALRR